jgi:hypothetical protein
MEDALCRDKQILVLKVASCLREASRRLGRFRRRGWGR